MSNRRWRRRQPWKPWTAPEERVRERIHVSEQANGRTRIDAVGADAGAMACIDAFRKGGATRVEFGWKAPACEETDDAPPPDVKCTWWFRVTMPDGSVQEGQSRPTTDHAMGVLEAAAAILRDGGGTFTIHRGAN